MFVDLKPVFLLLNLIQQTWRIFIVYRYEIRVQWKRWPNLQHAWFVVNCKNIKYFTPQTILCNLCTHKYFNALWFMYTHTHLSLVRVRIIIVMYLYILTINCTPMLKLLMTKWQLIDESNYVYIITIRSEFQVVTPLHVSYFT